MNSGEFREHLYESFMAATAESPMQLPRERSIVGRALVHLSQRIEPISGCIVDLDYRVAGGGPKSGYWLRTNNSDAYPVEIDLIVHQRAGLNFFCAEFKSGGPRAVPNLLDQAKVLFLLGRATRNGAPLDVTPSPYRLGATIGHQAEQVKGDPTGTHRWTVWWYETFQNGLRTIATPSSHVSTDDCQRRAALTNLNPARQLWAAVDHWTYPSADGLPPLPTGFPSIPELIP